MKSDRNSGKLWHMLSIMMGWEKSVHDQPARCSMRTASPTTSRRSVTFRWQLPAFLHDPPDILTSAVTLHNIPAVNWGRLTLSHHGTATQVTDTISNTDVPDDRSYQQSLCWSTCHCHKATCLCPRNRRSWHRSWRKQFWTSQTWLIINLCPTCLSCPRLSNISS